MAFSSSVFEEVVTDDVSWKVDAVWFSSEENAYFSASVDDASHRQQADVSSFSHRFFPAFYAVVTSFSSSFSACPSS